MSNRCPTQRFVLDPNLICGSCGGQRGTTENCYNIMCLIEDLDCTNIFDCARLYNEVVGEFVRSVPELHKRFYDDSVAAICCITCHAKQSSPLIIPDFVLCPACTINLLTQYQELINGYTKSYNSTNPETIHQLILHYELSDTIKAVADSRNVRWTGRRNDSITLINQPLKNVQEQIRQLESFELIAITRQGKYKLAQRTNKTEQMLSELLELFNLHETPNSGVSSENHNA